MSSWYFKKESEQPRVIVSSWSDEGVAVYIDGIRYFCRGYKPREKAKLDQYIKNKAWGKAIQVIRNWPAERQELRR